MSDTDGIPLDNWGALYYELPTSSNTPVSVQANLNLIHFQNTNWAPKHNWVLLAVLNGDSVSGAVKWLPGSTLIPTPTSGNTITWSPNSQQLGRGSSKIILDGGTGNVAVPGSVTVGTETGLIAGVSVDHAILLRGDTTNPTLNYNIMPGDTCAFIEYGGIWRFRQIQENSNQIKFEITPTYVNIPTSLRVGGYTAGIRPFVSCAVYGGSPQDAPGIYWTKGQNAVSVTRVDGPTGLYRVSWSPVTHPDGNQYVPQYSVMSTRGFVYLRGMTSTFIELNVSDANGNVLDRDFFLTIT